MKKIPVILDCDPGVDDAIAIMFALANRDILDIKCISTIGGNYDLDKVTRNALQILELLEVTDIPVVKGLSKPLVKDLEELHLIETLHDATGMGEHNLPQPEMQASDMRILDMYAQILEKTEEKVTFVMTGPQTNLALLLMYRPDLKDKIEKIVFVSGSCFLTNSTPHPEFNIYVDPEALRAVKRMRLPMVMCGMDINPKSYIKPSELKVMADHTNKTSSFISKILKWYTDEVQSELLHEDAELLIYLNGVMSVLYVVHPELFETKDLFVKIHTDDDGMFLGSTLVDYKNELKRPVNMEVCVDIQRTEFIKVLADSIHKLA